MAIQLLPSNPFNILKSYFYVIYLKINEIATVVNSGTGANASQLIQKYVAGENLGGQRAVVIDNGKVVYLQPNDLTNIGKKIGITNQAAAQDDLIEVVICGEVKNSGWSLLPDAVYYVAANGILSTTIPASPNYFQRVGTATSADSLLISFSEPVEQI
jgi:hypothetical protein